MNCAGCERFLFLHAHGQLRGPRRWLVESHLEGCDTCRARWARWVVEKDALRRALAPLPETDGKGNRLMNSVAARVRAEAQAASGSLFGLSEPRLPKGSRMAALGLTVALLAAGLSAMAAYWQPAISGALSAGPASGTGNVLPVTDSCAGNSPAGTCPTCGQALPATPVNPAAANRPAPVLIHSAAPVANAPSCPGNGPATNCPAGGTVPPGGLK